MTTAKIYATPPSIEKLCDLFQDFYVQADAHIATHIQALSTKQGRDSSPTPSIASRASSTLKPLSRINSTLSQDGSEQSEKPVKGQKMLTAGEISERRKARKLLHYKRLALEEAIERRACEGIYDKIWRHKGTLDEVRDEKLRSRTAALAVVGIGLKDLGVTFEASDDSEETAAELTAQVEEWIAKAKLGILAMNESHNPLGKLQSLAHAHRTIVDLLSNLHQSSSSADEILPTLIYTLISFAQEGVNPISNLGFIQRFRAASRINGEAAYCLTNLEASITFLETVDLATLRSDEAVELGSKASSRTSTPGPDPPKPGPAKILASPVTTPLTAVPSPASLDRSSSRGVSPAPAPTSTPSLPSPHAHHRRLSSLLQPPATALGAAGDAVRHTADSGFRSVGAALDNSFTFLFGRLKEQRLSVGGDAGQPDGAVAVLPKTLDDARRLVSPRLPLDEDGTLSEASSVQDADGDGAGGSPVQRDTRLVEMIAGRGKERERSADGSAAARRNAAATEAKGLGLSASPSPSPGVGSAGPASAVDSVRALGSSFNPLNRLASMNVMRFGRGPAAPASDASSPSPGPAAEAGRARRPEISPMPLRIEPPIRRFLEVEDSAELKVGEVDMLLRDYQRLARMLREEDLV